MSVSKQALINKLAINGGQKAVTDPFPPRGHFGAEEKAAADRILDAAIASGSAPIYGGEEEDIYCKEFSELLGGGYADAVNSGSTAVFVALRALEIEPFSEIIVGSVTDPGGFMPIPLMNCVPVVADTNKDTFNMSLDSVKKLVTPLTKAIVVPHIAGEPADIENIAAFAKEKGIYVVEDCAQAHGAELNGKLMGTFGDIAAYSTMYGKHTCTGGQGGMVFTKSEELYWKIRQNSDRGKPFGLPAGSDNCVASLNMNLEELSCAIGRVQIKKMRSIAEGRRRVVDKIKDGIKDIPWIRPTPILEGAKPSYWFFRMLVDVNKITCTKNEFAYAISAEGLGVNTYYQATPYTAEWYLNRKVFGSSRYPWEAPEYKGDHDKYYTLADLPNTKAALENTIIIYPVESWTDETISEVSAAFKKVASAY
jgi:dTDP-4-amino-4,6-dideoxygalactose transaminase